jgi:putative heme-binding domain-containing protein
MFDSAESSRLPHPPTVIVADENAVWTLAGGQLLRHFAPVDQERVDAPMARLLPPRPPSQVEVPVPGLLVAVHPLDSLPGVGLLVDGPNASLGYWSSKGRWSLLRTWKNAGLASLSTARSPLPGSTDILVALPELGRVVRVSVIRAGDSVAALDSDLLYDPPRDFRPIFAGSDRDGSILVVDSGKPGFRAGQILRLVSKTNPNRVESATESAKLDPALLEKLARLAPVLDDPAADPQAGELIFRSSKAQCQSCHRLGGNGGDLGPDLSRIGDQRKGSELLEALIAPSARIAKGFGSLTLALRDGRIVEGILARQDDRTLELKIPNAPNLSIPRAEVEMLLPSDRSLMPEGLEERLTRSELRDLLAYLKRLRLVTNLP